MSTNIKFNYFEEGKTVVEDGYYICIRETELIKLTNKLKVEDVKTTLNFNALFGGLFHNGPFEALEDDSVKKYENSSDEEIRAELLEEKQTVFLDPRNLCILKATDNKFMEYIELVPGDAKVGILYRKVPVFAYCKIDKISLDDMYMSKKL